MLVIIDVRYANFSPFLFSREPLHTKRFSNRRPHLWQHPLPASQYRYRRHPTVHKLFDSENCIAVVVGTGRDERKVNVLPVHKLEDAHCASLAKQWLCRPRDREPHGMSQEGRLNYVVVYCSRWWGGTHPLASVSRGRRYEKMRCTLDVRAIIAVARRFDMYQTCRKSDARAASFIKVVVAAQSECSNLGIHDGQIGFIL